MKLVYLFLLLHLTACIVALRHTLCSTESMNIRGMDVVAASKNTVLVVVFMPLQCALCHRQLKRLSQMCATSSDVRVVVLAPYYEAPVTVSRAQTEFPRLVIDRDVDSGVWRTFEAANHDQIVFDRCGRVTQVISHPRSDLMSYRDTTDAIERARQHSPCGPCLSDSSSGGQQRSAKQRHVDPRRYEDHTQRARPPAFTVRANYNARTQTPEETRRQTYTNPQTSYDDRRAAQYHHQTMTPTTTASTYAQWNRQMQQPNTQQHSDPYRSGFDRPNPNSYQNPSNVDFRDRANQAPYGPTPSTPFSPPVTSRRPSSAAQQHTYGPDEDYEDDLLPPAQTTPALQTQIPTPTTFDPLWPTPAPGQYFFSDPRNPQKQLDPRFTKFGEQASENNIPCSAYTDDICYQQQEKLGREGLSKCCQRGIYLTDVCIPGKCSNNTVQLCCFQKFLQARFRCCEDENQALGPASTMDFSKCCYEHFVNEDDCCSAEIAQNYWRSVHEVCYPNTKVDYSNIKMEVRFAEGVRVVDLNENRIWDYECRNGVNRTQYAYLP